MDHRSDVTLKLRDVLDIPGVGTRVISAINQVRSDRYQIQLDAKFEPSITVDVLVSAHTYAPRVGPAPAEPRLNSRDPHRISEDLSMSLWLALSTRDQSLALRMSAEAIVDTITNYWDGEGALLKVMEVFGPAVYGAVLRFHMEAGTSLSNTAEVLSSRSRLAAIGLSVGDLEWPREVLHDFFQDEAAPTDAALEARLADAVSSWKRTHAEPSTDTTDDSSLA